MIKNYILFALFLTILFCSNLNGQGCKTLFVIKDNAENSGYIDCNGKIIVEPQPQRVNEFNEGVGIVSSPIGNGFVNLSGKVTFLPGIEFIGNRFSEGVVLGKINGKLGFIDKFGNIAIELTKYGDTLGFSEGVATIPVNNKYCFIDKKGKQTIKIGFDDVIGNRGFIDGIATVLINDKYGVVDQSGNFIINPQKNMISQPSNGLVRLMCEKNGSWVYFNKQGKVALSVRYDYADIFSEELAGIEVKGKWGFMDKAGRIAIAPMFDSVGNFSEGLATVIFKNKLGFIDKKGNFVINPKFDYLSYETKFKNGLSYVYSNDSEGYINKKGDWIWRKPRK